MHPYVKSAPCRPPLTCLYCGEPETVEVLEIWPPRDFQLETCCEGMHEAVCEFLADDPRAAARYIGGTLRMDKTLSGMRGTEDGLRRVIDDGCGHLVLDWNLTLREVAWREARAFVAEHHRHCRPPAGWKFGHAVHNGFETLGVICRPVSRVLAASGKVVEVNRNCVRDDLADGLQWNACSKLYGWAAREARQRGYEWIITYTRADEPGTTLEAAGWVRGPATVGRHWSAPSRPREVSGDAIDKVRWHRQLVKRSTVQLPTGQRVQTRMRAKPGVKPAAAQQPWQPTLAEVYGINGR